jgi:hypothetical protein
MTPQEKQAKREWGTGACQVRGCTARAAYLALESSSGADGGDWWQYCCPKHAREYVEQHGLEMPAPASYARQRASHARQRRALLSPCHQTLAGQP